MKDIDAYGKFTEDFWFPVGRPGPLSPDEYGLVIMALGLPGEVGEACEHIKKYFRDGVLDRDALKKELGDVGYYWARICKFFGFEPSEVIAANIEKLESRRTRGVLHGNGDNR